MPGPARGQWPGDPTRARKPAGAPTAPPATACSRCYILSTPFCNPNSRQRLMGRESTVRTGVFSSRLNR